MSTGEDQAGSTVAETEAAEAPRPKLDLDVQITDAGPCKKHIKVAVARADIERQFDESLGTLRREAAVPGFRPGRAPRELVQRRFRKEVAGQVKSALLMASLEQLDEDHKLKPISQPDLDVEAIELPDDGPMRFEMDVEVEPDFPVPAYKALTVKRPVKTIQEMDVDEQYRRFLEGHGQVVPKFEGGAEEGDLITAEATLEFQGVVVNQIKESQFRVLPILRFQDAHVPDFARAMQGARPGETREAQVIVGSSSGDPALRGKTLRAIFHVLDLKQYRLPEVDPEFLRSVGFDSVEDLRGALRGVLERRYEFQQRQAMRRDILQKLVAETPFDLPADLVRRQEQSTLRRRVLEMRRAGLSDAEIRGREAEIRANAHESTLQDLKEYFILSRIADAEGIKVDPEDVEQEIEVIAARTDESPRRVRARIEKEGLAEPLTLQILERKTIDRILEYVAFEDVPLEAEEKAVETLDETAGPPAPEGQEAVSEAVAEPSAGPESAPAEGAPQG